MDDVTALGEDDRELPDVRVGAAAPTVVRCRSFAPNLTPRLRCECYTAHGPTAHYAAGKWWIADEPAVYDELGWGAEILNRLTFVTWDRLVPVGRGFWVYGWIPRDDGRSDFVSVELEPEAGLVSFQTSSAKHSLEIQRLLFGHEAGHRECERVEHVFGDRVRRKVVL